MGLTGKVSPIFIAKAIARRLAGAASLAKIFCLTLCRNI